MKKIDRVIMWFLALGFPIIFGFMIYVYKVIDPALIQGKAIAEEYTGGIWDYFGIFFMTWLVLAIITLVRLLVSSSFRELVLSFVARVKERDEREVEISGHAAKFAFFANLALLFLLLFFSTVNFQLTKFDKSFLDGAGEPKHGKLTVGFGLKSSDKAALKISDENGVKEVNYNDLPITKAGLIIVLIAWQIGMYHLSARKKLNAA